MSSSFWSYGCPYKFLSETGTKRKTNVAVHIASLSLTVYKHLTEITWLLIHESYEGGITRKSYL